MRRLVERYRLPEEYLKYTLPGSSRDQGFFAFGENIVCFGSCSAAPLTKAVGEGLADVRQQVRFRGGNLQLPFDPDQLIDNLLLERYPPSARNVQQQMLLWNTYYTLRPLLPRTLRRYLQRLYLSGWERIPFPEWPVDLTVERLLEEYLALLMTAQGLDTLPFIWFWPNAYESCAVVTHDVETEAGRRFCSSLMDLDDSVGVKASFQIVPEGRYAISPAFLEEIRTRGFEVNVQDLNHDGHLLRDETQFMERVVSVNRYGREFGAKGFRAAVLYRNLRWWHALRFEYDMSVPNVAHLEPQRGGCCTVFPYFIDDLLEVPATTTQDYALFHLLSMYSLDLWQRQIETIHRKHGLISILVHPDYILATREREIYLQLLRFLRQLHAERNTWIATPGQVNEWWRTRSRLCLTRRGAEWQIVGSGCERARLAFARLDGKTVRYEIAGSRADVTAPSRTLGTETT